MLEGTVLGFVLRQPGAEPFPIMATTYTWNKYARIQIGKHL